MIKQITKIKNYRIFDNFSWDEELIDFSKYNLIKGKNGSGKSTLCDALRYFDYTDKKKDTSYTIELLENERIVSNKSMNGTLKNRLYIFDNSFIARNLDTLGNFNEIIYLSEENIERKNRVLELEKELTTLKIKNEEINKEYETRKRQFERLLTLIAGKIKRSMIEIGGSIAKGYSSYTRGKALDYYNKHQTELEREIEDKYELGRIKKALKETDISYIKLNVFPIDLDRLNEAIENAKKTLKKDVSKQVTKNNSSSILSWIEEGLKLCNETDTCPFCGGIISKEKEEYLRSLFTSDYNELKEEITAIAKELEGLKMPLLEIYEEVYKDFRTNFKELVWNLNSLIRDYNLEIEALIKQLEEKYKDINKCDFVDVYVSYDSIQLINKLIEEMKSLVKQINDRTYNFEAYRASKIDKYIFLLHQSHFNKEAFYSRKWNLEQSKTKLEESQERIDRVNEELSSTEESIVDVIKAIDNFNMLLHEFLGRDDLTLVYNYRYHAYSLIRKGQDDNATNLSEGEKTAIAFIYFLIKIQENGNRIEDTIVILDDPITGLDSYNIEKAYELIVKMFKDCHQLFITTHNDLLYNLMQDKMKKDWNEDSNLYALENYTNNNNLRGVKLLMHY